MGKSGNPAKRAQQQAAADQAATQPTSDVPPAGPQKVLDAAVSGYWQKAAARLTAAVMDSSLSRKS